MQDPMNSEVEIVEERLKSYLSQLHAECAIFERIVYKNKNQHRRSSYFQYLLKVRRDLRLLQLTKLDELLSSCFQVITGKKPKQKVFLLESLKRRKCEDGRPNFMEQLLGAARLLAEMVEPILKAACEISVLLAQSFFMGFALTVLALLARFRVLVQQILLDVVSIFNMVTTLSQQKQSVKLTQEGVEVFREFYPKKQDYTILECVWKTDKFTLVESTCKREQESKAAESVDVLPEVPAVRYGHLKSFLEGDEVVLPMPIKDESELLGGAGGKQEEFEGSPGAMLCTRQFQEETCSMEGDRAFPSSSSIKSDTLESKSGPKKVAFVSVKRPISTQNVEDLPVQKTQKKNDEKGDPFFNLLTEGKLKDSLF